MSSPEIQVLPNAAAIAAEAADRFIAAAAEAIRLRDVFTVALAGGSTPKAMYKLLAEEPRKSQVDWTRTEIYFADERCVPPDHAESNFRMANEAMISHVLIPAGNVHRMQGEIDPETSAKAYGQLLKSKFGDGGGVDLCLLGMGDDGHTASMFPYTPAVKEKEHRVVAQLVEKSTTGKSWRITTTAPFINRSGRVMFLVTGQNKAARLREVLEGEYDPERLPSQLIDPEKTTVTWLLDPDAAGMNEED